MNSSDASESRLGAAAPVHCSSTTYSVQFVFFQAEGGIRYIGVTGVQTCALPICTMPVRSAASEKGAYDRSSRTSSAREWRGARGDTTASSEAPKPLEGPNRESGLPEMDIKIGRASCRERVQISVVAVSLKKT